MDFKGIGWGAKNWNLMSQDNQVEDSCKPGNVISDSIKCGEI
jgi:hypothetical protein